MLCCVPCYCFNDECFIKKRLISKQKASNQTLKLVPKWTWVYRQAGTDSQIQKNVNASEDLVFDPAEKCFICFQNFERGVEVTYIPCQIQQALNKNSVLNN